MTLKVIATFNKNDKPNELVETSPKQIDPSIINTPNLASKVPGNSILVYLLG